MARPGVTYQDIANAASEVKGQGKNPTIENVRAILGTGSIGTINNHLRKWKEAQNFTQKIASKENLPQELVSMIKGLWDQLINQSQEIFTKAESDYQVIISESQQELQKYKTNNQRWQQMFNQWQQEKMQLANDKLTLEQALEFSHKETTSLQSKQDSLLQQLQEKQQRIEELHRLQKQSQENLEHYRESTREQRLLDQQQYEHQKQLLQIEAKALNEQLLIFREKSFISQQELQSLQETHNALEKSYAHTQLTIEQLKIKLENSEHTAMENLHANQHWQNQYKEAQSLLAEKNNQLMDFQTQVKLLTQQLADINQITNHLQDQNKILTHDKWIIVQEKAQLEGQLKQMQKTIA